MSLTLPHPSSIWRRALAALVLVPTLALSSGQALGAQESRSSEATAASSAEVESLRQTARAAFEKAPAESAPAWRALVDAAPDDGEGWYRLGYALHMAGALDDALVAHRRATEIGYSPSSAFNIACVLALQGKKDEALAALDAAVDKGFLQDQHAMMDADLASIRSDPRFAAVIQRMRDVQTETLARRKRVAVLVYPGVELLDFAGPLEAFGAVQGRGMMFHAFTVARDKTPMRTQGVAITADYDFSDCPQPDVVVIPGGSVGNVLDHGPTMKWLASVQEGPALMMSVCNGIHALADLGVLDELEVTTHRSAMARIRSTVPGVTVREDLRFVDNGDVITAAGVSAGIDGALHVIDRLCGREVAARTAHYMEYEWRPDRIGPYGIDDPGKARERAGIARAVEHYLDGILRKGGVEHVEAGLHRDLDKLGFGRKKDENGAHKTYPRSYADMHSVAERLGERGGREGTFSNFEILDVQELIAVVKVRATWGTDYLTLGRFGDRWQVRHILWQQDLEPEGAGSR